MGITTNSKDIYSTKMSDFNKIFGSKLLRGETEVNTADALAGLDAVGIYFSAHWCPPCRGFTPVLAEKYKALKDAGKKFEIVFASSDRDEGAFKEYYAEMPWLALPYSERDLKAELASEHNCRGIPYLVIIDGSTGKTITTDGRAEVTNPNYIKNFPWKPTPMSMAELGDTLRNPDGSTVSTKDALEGVEALGIYFSAHWCPPCRGFTPVAAENYKALKAAGKKVEIIFASSDKDEAAFNEYHAEMPWKALPYSERDKKASLAKRYKCQGIPHLVFVDPKTWETITLNSRGGISSASFIEDFPYHPKSSYDLSESMDGLTGKNPVFICFTDACDSDTKKEVSGAVRAFADSAKEKGETHLAKYFTANGSKGIEVQMRPSFGMQTPPPAKHTKELTLMVPEVDNVAEYSGGWVCNGCRRHGPASEANYRNKEDQFDYCTVCYDKAYNQEAKPLHDKPSMFVLNFTSRKFWRPKEGEEAVTVENIQKLLDNHKAGSLVDSTLEL